jgi:hypothetical protein
MPGAAASRRKQSEFPPNKKRAGALREGASAHWLFNFCSGSAPEWAKKSITALLPTRNAKSTAKEIIFPIRLISPTTTGRGQDAPQIGRGNDYGIGLARGNAQLIERLLSLNALA